MKKNKNKNKNIKMRRSYPYGVNASALTYVHTTFTEGLTLEKPGDWTVRYFDEYNNDAYLEINHLQNVTGIAIYARFVFKIYIPIIFCLACFLCVESTHVCTCMFCEQTYLQKYKKKSTKK